MSRGPSIHLGYHNNPDANAQAFTKDGWFRTGDLGRVVDADGNVQITGRSKEIINRGGKKFFPREVEEILYTCRTRALAKGIVSVSYQKVKQLRRLRSWSHSCATRWRITNCPNRSSSSASCR